MVLGCRRIHKPGKTFTGFSQIFMELGRVKVQFAPPQVNFVTVASLTPKLSFAFQVKAEINISDVSNDSFFLCVEVKKKNSGIIFLGL